MSPTIKEWMEKIDNRVLRERVLIFLTLLALVFLLWNFLIQGPIDDERKALDAKALQISADRQTLESQISTYTVALANDPAVARKNDIAQLHKKISDVEARLSGLSQGLIGATQLPKALEDVLQKTRTIRLLQVRTLPAIELHIPHAHPAPENTVPGQEKADEGGTGVYKHAVWIKVTGSYAELLELMTEIESLDWKFYWESLDYSVTRYPAAEIDIRVFTLSSEEGLLGV